MALTVGDAPRVDEYEFLPTGVPYACAGAVVV